MLSPEQFRCRPAANNSAAGGRGRQSMDSRNVGSFASTSLESSLTAVGRCHVCGRPWHTRA
eukprot:825167-Lingulodinium_polyedra.AAC.1